MGRVALLVTPFLLAACPAAGGDDEVGSTGESESTAGTSESSSGESESSSSESSSSESSSGESESSSGESESSSGESESSSGESESSTTDTSESDSTETGEPLEPGACAQEQLEDGPDEFVGDGIADVDLRVVVIDAPGVPLELAPGSRIHVQGSYNAVTLCGDDDVSCPDSFVVRSYPDERFVLAQLARNDSLEPLPEQALFDALGTDVDTWLRPFSLTVVEEMLCSWQLGVCSDPNIITRPSLLVDAGVCETARLLDESHGALGEIFFVALDDIQLAEGGTLCVDDPTRSQVFISRQPCAGDACPDTADVVACPPDAQLLQDWAELVYLGWAPSELGVDLVCEVLAADQQGNEFVHALDCGVLAP
jgi:hypothetical protein